MIAEIPASADLGALRSWFGDWVAGEYRFLRQFGHDPCALWWSEFERARATPGSRLLIAGDGPTPRAAVLSVDLPWEQKLMGAPARGIRWIGGTVDGASELSSLLSEDIRMAGRDGVSFMSARIYTDQAPTRSALEANGFVRVDRLVDYVRSTDPSPSPPLAAEYRIRLARAGDTGALAGLARTAFKNHFGRFQADPLASDRLRQSFYPQWVESALSGYADFVYVAEWEGRPVGCSIWRRPSTVAVGLGIALGHYSLGFVDPGHAGRGIFRALNHRALAHSRVEGALLVEGPTHLDNLPVRKAYEASGWRPVDEREAFHLWLGR